MSMCVDSTPVEHYPDLGLWVKREDQCCPHGPHFSKTRGVYAHVARRPEKVIGVLDTGHSQGGWAVAQACRLLGKECVLYYPQYKKARPEQPQQRAARELGAALVGLPAGRSAVLYHQARRHLLGTSGSYMMPNALKLPEMVEETAAEVCRTPGIEKAPRVLVSASSGTIAAGVLRGLTQLGWEGWLIVHMGYSRPEKAVREYISRMSGVGMSARRLDVVDEGYSYADAARPGEDAPFPCNAYYDLKLFRWWTCEGRARHRTALMWNIG